MTHKSGALEQKDDERLIRNNSLQAPEEKSGKFLLHKFWQIQVTNRHTQNVQRVRDAENICENCFSLFWFSHWKFYYTKFLYQKNLKLCETVFL